MNELKHGNREFTKLVNVRNRAHESVAEIKERHDVSRMKPKTQKSVSTRKKIIKAATEIIAKKGSADFQMSEVASRCHMSKGALYYYFRNRDEIIDEILIQELDDFVEHLEASVESCETPHEALKQLCIEFAQSVDGRNNILATIGTELSRGGAETFDRVMTRFGVVNKVFEKQVDEAKELGLVKDYLDTKLLASCISGTFFFAAFSTRAHKTDDFSADKLADELLEIITNGVARK